MDIPPSSIDILFLGISMKKRITYTFNEVQLKAIIAMHINDTDPTVEYNHMDLKFFNGTVELDEKFSHVDVTVSVENHK